MKGAVAESEKEVDFPSTSSPEMRARAAAKERPKQAAQTSIWVSHIGGRSLRARIIIQCLPGSFSRSQTRSRVAKT